MSREFDLQELALSLKGLAPHYVSGIPRSMFSLPVIEVAEEHEGLSHTPLLILTDSGTQRHWRSGNDGALLEAALEKGLKRSAPDVVVLHFPERAPIRMKEIIDHQASLVLVLGDSLWYRLAVSAPDHFGLPFKEVFGHIQTIGSLQILGSYRPQESLEDSKKKREFWTHLQLIMHYLKWS